MRITTDLEEQVSREFIARRAAMAAELSARTVRTPAVQRETAPAARADGDEVHISPEARATAWARANAPAQPLRAFPSPSEVVAALRALVELPAREAPDAALKSVGELLAGLVRGLPGEAPGGAQTPSAALAGAVVRLFLGEPGRGPALPDGTFDVPAALRAVQDLIAAGAEPSAGQQTTLERAAAALMLAVLRWRAAGTAPLPAPGPAGDSFPAALLSLAGTQSRAPRMRRRKSGAFGGAAEPEDELDARDTDAARGSSDRAPGGRTSPGTPAAG